MVVANERAYKDALGWMRAARPRGVGRFGFAFRRFKASFIAGLGVMGFLALVDPGAFSQTGTAPTLGWGGWLATATFAVCLIYGLSKRTEIRELVDHVRQPFVRPLEENPSYEGAYGALSACSSTFVSRFGFGWVWLPAGLLVVGAVFAFSDAYFVIDAFLARFDVGWGVGVLFGVDLIVAFVCFALAARRLSTWRLAASVHKSATTGYAT